MTLKDAELTKELFIRPSSVVLWITIATGPVAFAIQFQSRFALVEWACGNHRSWVLTVIALTALIAAAGSAVVAWSAFVRLDPVLQRPRFMAMAGFVLSCLCALAIIAQAIPHAFLGACD